MDNVIAERSLTLEVPGAERPSTIRVLLGKPTPEGGGRVSPYEIHGPDPGEVWRAGGRGVDALQALIVTVGLLPHELARYGRRGRLTWEGSEELHLGLALSMHEPAGG